MLDFFFDDVRRMAAGLPPNAEPNDAMRAAAELWRRLDGIGTVGFVVGALALAAAGVGDRARPHRSRASAPATGSRAGSRRRCC